MNSISETGLPTNYSAPARTRQWAPFVCNITLSIIVNILWLPRVDTINELSLVPVHVSAKSFHCAVRATTCNNMFSVLHLTFSAGGEVTDNIFDCVRADNKFYLSSVVVSQLSSHRSRLGWRAFSHHWYRMPSACISHTKTHDYWTEYMFFHRKLAKTENLFESGTFTFCSIW